MAEYEKNSFDASGATQVDEVSKTLDALGNTIGYASAAKQISPFRGKLSKDVNAGLDNTKIEEAVPKYHEAPCEDVYKGDNNTWIILGRDRNQSWSSGYGGKGHTGAGAIDIVTGLQGWGPVHKEVVQKNFGSMSNDKPGDAARIYISQRADIDDYFNICDAAPMGRSVALSAIGIKADSVRIMARRGIKIVTGQSPQQTTSLGGKIPAQFGIDLIAGNRDDNLQPITRGHNLTDCLEGVLDQISDLNALFSDYIVRQMMINIALAGFPVSGLAGPIPVVALSSAIPAVSENTMKQIANDFAELIKQNIELLALKTDYLSEIGSSYVNSKYNRTN